MASSAAKKVTEAPKSTINPFKVRSTSDKGSSKKSDAVVVPAEVATAIDGFREAMEQAKHFEGEATLHKETVLSFARGEYAKRAMVGTTDSFKLLGEQAMVTYIVADNASGLTQDEVDAVAEEFGAEAVEQLVGVDYGSIRFDAQVLEENYDDVIQALQVLKPEVLERLFKPGLQKAKKGAVESARRIAKDAGALSRLLAMLKITNYIK
jgi:hypothetical protein